MTKKKSNSIDYKIIDNACKNIKQKLNSEFISIKINTPSESIVISNMPFEFKIQYYSKSLYEIDDTFTQTLECHNGLLFPNSKDPVGNFKQSEYISTFENEYKFYNSYSIRRSNGDYNILAILSGLNIKENQFNYYNKSIKETELFIVKTIKKLKNEICTEKKSMIKSKIFSEKGFLEKTIIKK
jgi:hypothetical protein